MLGASPKEGALAQPSAAVRYCRIYVQHEDCVGQGTPGPYSPPGGTSPGSVGRSAPSSPGKAGGKGFGPKAEPEDPAQTGVCEAGPRGGSALSLTQI